MQITKQKRFTLRNSKGFTLIELLVVIAIIGLLAGIVLVSLGGARTSAQDARRQTDIRNIITAMELCYNDTACQAANQYLVTAGPVTQIASHMPLVPPDPTTGVAYNWADTSTATPTGQRYCITATLSDASIFCGSQDGVAGTSTAAANTLDNCCGL